jgi:hypothetical protein
MSSLRPNLSINVLEHQSKQMRDIDEQYDLSLSLNLRKMARFCPKIAMPGMSLSFLYGI